MLLIVEILVAIAGGLGLIFILADRPFAAPRYQGPITDHFKGRIFRNSEPSERKGSIDFLRWQLTSKRGHWNRWTDSEAGRRQRSLQCFLNTGCNLAYTWVGPEAKVLQAQKA